MENCAQSVVIKFASPAEIRLTIETALQAESLYETAVGDLTAKLNPALKQADAQGKKFILRAKKILRLQLGIPGCHTQSQSERLLTARGPPGGRTLPRETQLR